MTATKTETKILAPQFEFEQDGRYYRALVAQNGKGVVFMRDESPNIHTEEYQWRPLSDSIALNVLVKCVILAIQNS